MSSYEAIHHAEQINWWERYSQICEKMKTKQNPRTLILQVLSGKFPINFMGILAQCLYQSGKHWIMSNEGLVLGCEPKTEQKYRRHLQALVKTGRVIKSKQRVISHSPKFTLAKTYYSLRKKERGMSNLIDNFVQNIIGTEDELRYLCVFGIPKAEVQQRIRSAVEQWQTGRIPTECKGE